MRKVVFLCIMLGALLWAVDPWTGTIDVGPWWVKDNAGGQQWHQYRGLCVLNDSVAWVVEKDGGQVWTLDIFLSIKFYFVLCNNQVYQHMQRSLDF